MIIKRITLLGLLAASIFTLGCAKLNKDVAPKQFVIEKRWVRNTLVKENYGFRHTHRMEPIIFGDLVIQGNAIDGISAYNKKSGHEQWRIRVKGGVEGGAQLHSGRLYFGASDGFFYAVNAETGEVYWTFPIHSEGLGAPRVSETHVYFLAGNNVAYSLDIKSGKQAWVYNRRDPNNISIRGGSRPAISGDNIYFGFSDGYVVALNKTRGTLLWERPVNRSKRFKDVDSEPIIDGKRLYVSSYDDGIYCLEKKSGRLIWRIDEGGHSAVTLTPKRLFYSTASGEVISADKSSGKILWRHSVKNGVATRPVFFKGLIAFGEFSGPFQVLSADSGELIGHYNTGRGVTSTPWIDQKTGDAYVITVNANLFAFRLSWKSPAETWPWEWDSNEKVY